MIHTQSEEGQPAHIRGEALWLVVFSLSAASLMLLGARDVGMWALDLIVPLLR